MYKTVLLGASLAIALPLWVSACNQSDTAVTANRLLAPIKRQLIPLESSNAQRLLIPQNAVIKRGGIPMVFVLQKGEARARMIKRGKSFGTRVEIISGLMGNETLILGELQSVHDGSPIQTQ